MCTKWLPTPSDCSKISLRGLEEKVFSLQREEAIFFSRRENEISLKVPDLILESLSNLSEGGGVTSADTLL